MTDLDDLIKKLESRGTMYMGWVTIERLGGFLLGWLQAKGGDIETEGYKTLEEYRLFLCDRFDMPDRYGWESILILVSQKKNCDAANFFQTYWEFRTSQES